MNTTQQNSQEYWEEAFSSKLEQKMKLAQARFFYDVFAELFPQDLKKILSQTKFSCCDFGCGLGNFTNKLHDIFPQSSIYGIDFSKNAIQYAQNHFSTVSFLNMDYNNLSSNFDIIVTSNTLEHFSNPTIVIQKLLQHTNKFFIMLIPYEEIELYKEHLFSFSRSFFKDSFQNFELIYLKSIDLSDRFNTMWLGKQILAVYKEKSIHIDFKKQIYIQSEYKRTLNQKINLYVNHFRRNCYRTIRKILIKES